MKTKHIIEQNRAIVEYGPTEPGDTISHEGAAKCVELGLAKRLHGRFV